MAPLTGSRVTARVAWPVSGALWLTALLLTGSSTAAVASWVVSVSLGVLLPGVAVVRSCRRQTVALIEDIGWGIPAGCVVAMLGWAAGVLSPWGMQPWVFGPLVVGVLVGVPRLRHRVLARPEPGWGRGPNLVLTGSLVVVVAWMTFDYLWLYPADPGGAVYYPDTVFQLAVVGHLQHSLELTYPLVSGEPFSYQWFTHAVLAHLLDGGPPAFDAVIRLAPATVMPAVVVTSAVVARDVARSVTAGPIAALLTGVIGVTVGTWTAQGQSRAVFQDYWWASLTTSFGWLATIPVAGCVVALLRGRSPTAPVLLLVPYSILAVGAKPSNLAVLLGGAVSALAYLTITRRPVRRAIAIVAFVGGLLLLAKATVYGGGSYGLQVDLGGRFQGVAARLFPGLTGDVADDLALTLPEVSTVALLTTLLLFGIPLIPRLIGLVFLVRHERSDPATWFFLGVLAAGLGALLVFRHPAGSEGFFLLSAYPVALLGSAWGLSVAFGRIRTPAVLGGAGLGLAAAMAVAAVMPADPGRHLAAAFGHAPSATEMAPVRQALHHLAPLAVLGIALALGAAAGYAWARRTPERTPVVSSAIVGALLGTGLLSTGIYITGTAPTLSTTTHSAGQHLSITVDEQAAGEWLRTNTRSDDVLAVNRVCLQDGRQGLSGTCTAKAFTMSALAGRDLYVGSWAYASRNHDTAWSAEQTWNAQPFWEPAKLERELRAFSKPSPQLLHSLADKGVRWMVADSRGGPVDASALDDIATRRFTSGTVSIWQIR